MWRYWRVKQRKALTVSPDCDKKTVRHMVLHVGLFSFCWRWMCMYKHGDVLLVLHLSICNLVQVKVKQDKWHELLPRSFFMNQLKQITNCWPNMNSENVSPVCIVILQTPLLCCPLICTYSLYVNLFRW